VLKISLSSREVFEGGTFNAVAISRLDPAPCVRLINMMRLRPPNLGSNTSSSWQPHTTTGRIGTVVRIARVDRVMTDDVQGGAECEDEP